MNKTVNTWIEGEGIVRTVVRNIVLWDYTSTERCQTQLLKIIEKNEADFNPYLLQHAVDKQKAERRWILVYLPIFMCRS